LITGIGELTAPKLVSYEIGKFETVRALIAFAGLNPVVTTSGQSVRRKSRLSKIGNARLRQALYMPAVSAMRFNPLLTQFAQFAQRLTQAGLCKMQIVGAVMRKLLVLAFGVLKTGKPFDPEFVTNGLVYP
jgi:transposase